jgi:hypothetical protein
LCGVVERDAVCGVVDVDAVLLEQVTCVSARGPVAVLAAGGHDVRGCLARARAGGSALVRHVLPQDLGVLLAGEETKEIDPRHRVDDVDERVRHRLQTEGAGAGVAGCLGVVMTEPVVVQMVSGSAYWPGKGSGVYAVAFLFHVVVPQQVERVSHGIVPRSSTSSVGVATRSVTMA